MKLKYTARSDTGLYQDFWKKKHILPENGWKTRMISNAQYPTEQHIC